MLIFFPTKRVRRACLGAPIRHRATAHALIVLFCAGRAWFGAEPAHAQVPPPGALPPALPANVPRLPDAGTLLQQQPQPPVPIAPPDGAGVLPAMPPSPAVPAEPTTPQPPEASFVLKDIILTGNDTVPASELLPLVAGWIGKRVTFDDLLEIGARITKAYRERGYLLGQVMVPPQDITSGEVRITVLEGRIGHVRLNLASDAPIRESLVRARLAAITPGQPLRQRELERTMLLLSDLPGVRVSSSIEAGEVPGTVDLDVRVGAARRWQFALTGDNYGTSSAGRVRIGAVGRLNSPFMLGDNLDINLLAAERLDTYYGRVGYDMPVGSAGTRVGVAASHLGYALGKQFTPLDATGTADILDLSASHPVIRTRQQNLLLRGAVEYRDLVDRIGAVGEDSRQSLWDASVALTYEGRDSWLGGGFNSAELQAMVANLTIHSTEQRAFDQSAFGRHTEGASVRMTMFANRLNAITDRLSIFAGLSGQWANKNLDNSSRVTLGGPRAVRAYSPSEAVVDKALITTAELRFSMRPELTLSAFYDFGLGWYNARPVPGQGDNRVTRGGVGIGVFWSAPHGLTVNATLAWRTGTKDSTGDDKVPRLYVQLTKTF